MDFDEVQFPVAISLGASGGPERRTEVVSLGSGYEERNALWLNSRRRYNIAYGIKTIDQVHDVMAFWEARNGRLYGFRYKDFADFKSVKPLQSITPLDQNIGTGDGVIASFQLRKTYTSGARSWARNISKPVAGTVRVAVAGAEKILTTQFTVALATGIITFTGGNIPTVGQPVTAGFEFDVPVRFDSDNLTINMDDFRTGNVPDISLVEVRI